MRTVHVHIHRGRSHDAVGTTVQYRGYEIKQGIGDIFDIRKDGKVIAVVSSLAAAKRKVDERESGRGTDASATLTSSMLSELRSEAAKINKVDPSEPTYAKLVAFLNRLDQPQLKQLAEANIKFISSLARNRIHDATHILATKTTSSGKKVELYHQEEGMTAAGSGSRPTKELWGVRIWIKGSGSYGGQQYKTEAEARAHYDRLS